MGGLFSGMQLLQLMHKKQGVERRTDALVRLAYDIKQVKLNIASDQSRRRTARLYASWMYLLLPVIVVGCMVGLGSTWWMGAIYASPVVLLIILVYWLINKHYDEALRENRAALIKLKDEKRKVLEDIKNTENYRVAKELLDKFDNSDDETADADVSLIHEEYGPSMV